MTATIRGIKFSDSDLVNPSEFQPDNDYSFGSRKIRLFLMHDHGFAVALVFADCLQDALDEAADAGKLDRYKVDESEMADYGDTIDEQCDRLSSLGNDGAPHDIDTLGIVELDPPAFSLVALFNAANAD